MTCEDCERHVATAFKQAGAREADADWRTGQARVEGEGLSEQKSRRGAGWHPVHRDRSLGGWQRCP